ncbi:protein NUCLEAR FUSION DEFECTIVE 2 [Phalaenopsis equestris]|uniref:protein NUCLEAR FUSION DEFECTIVE 2 n=1 Tax=Phalaenopsis equestris TaxID=78828 RepID=UPI0009E59C9C|nr:protein NUCLEAR FUSION DEFECTIVE 2 [Phalaenopsis equestris]
MAALLRLLSSFFSVYAFLCLPAALAASPSPAFSTGLEILQKQLGYQFKSVDLLRQAMTHPSYSLENNHALSLLGLNAMESAAALSLVSEDPNASAEAVNARIAKISGFDDCVSAGKRLAIENLVRVSKKTSTSSPNVICGAYRAIYGAIAVDAGGLDAASKALWSVLDGGIRAF